MGVVEHIQLFVIDSRFDFHEPKLGMEDVVMGDRFTGPGLQGDLVDVIIILTKPEHRSRPRESMNRACLSVR